jgi:DNA (cytosine-5)-methyltransferase 1
VADNPELFVAVDAFCGAGGLSSGLGQAGFDLRYAFDNTQWSMTTYVKNLGEHGEVADAYSMCGADVLKKANVTDLDLLAGGPPCQGFSKQKRGAHLGDRRNALVVEFLRLVEEVRPKAFLMENVAIMAQIRGRHLVDRFHELEDYELVGHFYVAADYGVAQTRERYFLVGIRKDQPGSFYVPPPTTPRWPTVGEVIGDLPEPPANYTEHPVYPNHQNARVTAININRFSYVPQGGGWQDIPFELRLPCHQVVDTSKGGWPDVYGRLEWDGQCPTITGGFDSFTRGRYGHPLYDRPLTPREAARLQGFPDEFVFAGTRYDVRHQIGNAVPVPLAKTVGSAIIAALRGETRRRQVGRELTLFD